MSDGVSKQTDDRVPIPFALANRSGSWVALRQIDLTGIGAVTLQAAAPAAYQAKGREDRRISRWSDRNVAGESEPILPTSDDAPVSRRVALQPTAGVHDLYFVFTNPDAGGNGFLFAVMTATFEAAAK